MKCNSTKCTDKYLLGSSSAENDRGGERYVLIISTVSHCCDLAVIEQDRVLGYIEKNISTRKL